MEIRAAFERITLLYDRFYYIEDIIQHEFLHHYVYDEQMWEVLWSEADDAKYGMDSEIEELSDFIRAYYSSPSMLTFVKCGGTPALWNEYWKVIAGWGLVP